MIVFACGTVHESHSFNRIPTPLSAFHCAMPGDIAAQPHLLGTRSIEGGVLMAASELGWDLHFPFVAQATPSGPLTRDCFKVLTDRMIDALRSIGAVDGVLMPLHGAMCAVDEVDCEGVMIARVREVVGPEVPIAIALDPHANVTDRMARLADILTSYRTTPHVDQWDTTYRAAQLLDAAMRRRTQPKLYVGRLPMLAGMDMGRTLDPAGPMAQLQSAARGIEQTEPGVLNIECNAGFYYGDVAEAGPSIVVTGDGDDPRYQKVADDLILDAWKSREFVSITFTPLDEAIERARRVPDGKGPLILVDYTDGPAGGAHADGTTLLALLLAADIPGTVVGPIFDPEAAALAITAGQDASLSLSVGGRVDPAYGGGPVALEATVDRVSDGRYLRKGPFATGTIGEFGPSASLSTGNVRVIVVSQRVQPEDREQYRLFGIDPEDVNILACKGINHFRADFEAISRELVFVDTGGLVSIDFTIFPFRNVRRPIWPLDEVELSLV